jgi:hypothetical protein
MGGQQCNLVSAIFNRAARVSIAHATISADAGAIVLRGVAKVLTLPQALKALRDSRDPARVTYPLQGPRLCRPLLVAQGPTDPPDANLLPHATAHRVLPCPPRPPGHPSGRYSPPRDRHEDHVNYER